MKEYILLDLDGTLTDPKIGITKSVQYALAKLGIIETSLDKLEKFIGPPLQDSFQAFYAFDRERARQAVDLYREYFTEKGMFENSVYAGIPEMLHALNDTGHKLYVATSKPTVFADKILTHFSLKHYFTEVVGSNLDGTRTDKAEIIAYIRSTLPLVKACRFVMVGDRKYDILGAKTHKIMSIGVSYGYGGVEELSQCQPDHIVDSVADLSRLLGVEGV